MVGLGSVGTSQDETQVPPTPNDENIITQTPNVSSNVPSLDEMPKKLEKRKRQKTSRAWEYFELLEREKEGAPQKAQCKHCGIKLICETKSHGTKNLLNHIDRCLKLKQKDISQMCISQAAGSFSMKPTVPDKKNSGRLYHVPL